MRRGWLAVACWLLLAAPVAAQVSTPYTFTNGTVADADQVNTNFAQFALALNRTGGTMTGTLNVQHVLPAVDNTYDLGSASFMVRSAYAKTSIVLGQTSGNYTFTWANPASPRAISIEDPGGTDIFVWKAAAQTLTNKTLTAPVFGGSITGTYTLAGTPTISSPVFTGTSTGTYTLAGTPTISSPVLSGTVTGTYTLGGTPTVSSPIVTGTISCTGCVTSTNILDGTILDADVNATAAIAWTKVSKSGSSLADLATRAIANLSDGSNVALLNAANTFTATGSHVFGPGGVVGNTAIVINGSNPVAGGGGFIQFQRNSVTFGNVGSTAALIGSGTSSDLAMLAAAGQGIGLYTNGANLRWGVNFAGDIVFGPSSIIAFSSGVPTLTSGGGTGAGVSGLDFTMTAFTGSSASTQMLISFGHSTFQPRCTAVDVSGSPVAAQATASSGVITLNYTSVTSHNFVLHCFGGG